MQKRFTQRLIFSPEMDFLDCPVEIIKGAILFDALKNTCVLQLKLNNLSNHSVSSIMIEVICFNDEAEPLNISNPIKYTYSNLVYTNGSFFGNDRLINTNFNNVCAVQIIIKKVVISTGYTWEYTKECVIKHQEQIPIPNIFKKILKKDKSIPDISTMKFIPIDNDNYWSCSCGKQNSSDHCLRCRLSKDNVFSIIDINTLKSNLNKYLIELEEKATQEYEHLSKQSQKASKLFKITSIILFICIIIISTSWIVNSTAKFIKFNQATMLMSKQEYYDAIKKFNSLPLSSHKTKMSNAIEYETKNILTKFRNNDITKEVANSQFAQLKNYKNIYDIKIYDKETDESVCITNYFSDQMRLLENSRANYEQANDYKSSGEYLNALSSYSKVVPDDLNYINAQSEIKIVKNLLKEDSITILENYRSSKNYTSALALLESINDYLSEDKDIQNYTKYFNAIKNGERYLESGWYYRRQDLYYEPIQSSSVAGYYTSNGNVTVYEYYIDNDLNLWVKTCSSDNEYFWVNTNE